MSPVEKINQITSVVKCESLSIATPRVYVALSCYADNKNGTCFPSMKTLMKKSQCTKPTIIKAIRELEETNFIKVLRQKGDGSNKVNLYQLMINEDTQSGKRDLPPLVNEIYHPSKRDLPEAVNEVYHNSCNELMNLTQQEKREQKNVNMLEAEKYIKLWNKAAKELELPIKRTSLSKSLRNKLHTRIGEGMTLDTFSSMMDILKVSTNFALGRESKNNWRITFDWLLSNDSNWQKLEGGNYTDKNKLEARKTEDDAARQNEELARKIEDALAAGKEVI